MRFVIGIVVFVAAVFGANFVLKSLNLD